MSELYFLGLISILSIASRAADNFSPLEHYPSNAVRPRGFFFLETSMGRKFVNIKGGRFGRLIAKRYVGGGYWKCKCDCGNWKRIRTDYLRNRGTKSCGCLFYHGLSSEPEYNAYSCMIARCCNPNTPNYHNYGGRGIKVCDKWKESPKAFIKWARENGWEPGLQIDRRDNDGDYTPDNCRLVTPKENTRNRRNSLYYTYKGETRLIAEWSEITGLSYNILKLRIRNEWSEDEVFSRPRHS